MNKNINYNAPELENLNSIEKIIKLQEDLKIVASIKQQFEGNQKKMIEKMNKFCLNYYKNKINMKKIFDYCSDNEAEKTYEKKHPEYTVLKNRIEKLTEQKDALEKEITRRENFVKILTKCKKRIAKYIIAA